MQLKWIGLGLCALSLVACDTPQNRAAMEAQRRAENRAAYVPRHSLDFNNYDKRQRISDDPTTIQWCTVFPSTPGVQPITFPIVGKLTSGSKRPFGSDPGPDGMYGSSGEYRYGFTPGDNMVDIFGSMSGFCTTEPTTWQRMNTTIVVQQDAGLAAAGNKASANIKGGASPQAALAAIVAQVNQPKTAPPAPQQ